MAKRNIEAIYPLSPMQEGMLFHSLFAPETGVYFEQFRLTLRGELDLEAFENAWQEVISRQSILRTAFTWKRLDQMLQVVHQEVDLPLEVQDWRKYPKPDQEMHLEKFLSEERRTGFDLSKAPLLRLRLFKIEDNAYYFVLSLHHIIMDGWSIARLLQEFLTLYEGFRGGSEINLPPAGAYRNYINWVNSQDQAVAEEYWKRALQGFTAPTQITLPDIIEAGEHSQEIVDEVGEAEISLSRDITSRLISIGKEHRVTLSTILQAAWAVLLNRYTSDKDVLFGATVAGRPPEIPGIESMIGLFINTLPLRIVVPAEKPVYQWLQDLQGLISEMRQYEYSSLVKIQQWSDVPGGVGLFDSIMVFENYPVNQSLREQDSNLVIEDFHSMEQTNYPLTIVAGPSDELTIKISYDRSKYTPSNISSTLGHLKTSLESIALDPEQLVKDIEILTQDERKTLTEDWGTKTIDFASNKSIKELFEDHVERSPDSIAIEFVNGSQREKISYRELNQRANMLANYLRKIGVAPNVLVGLCLERSVDLIVGLLGVIKSGGAYVPMSPNLPNDRITFMIKDTQIPVIITQEHLKERIAIDEEKIVVIDTDWNIISMESGENPGRLHTGKDLINVIYTSGSTGLSKGVMINHDGFTNFVVNMLDIYDISKEDRVLQFMNASFDASATEFYPPLVRGATLVMIRSADELLGQDLIDFYETEHISITCLPTAVWHLLVDELEDTGKILRAPLKLITIGGEKADIHRLENWNRHLETPIKFVNFYGPTEATVATTAYIAENPETTIERYKEIPIGRPLPNLRVYLLNEFMRPVPAGIPGELYIGGTAVAVGYLNRPGLTSDRFVSDPFSEEPGSRLYRTGDYARYLPDGNIEFIGRIDNQVKLRGFRVELGEIESVLGSHPDVRQTAVLVWEDAPDRKYLVAYLTPYRDQSIDIESIRTYLSGSLPDYMVPASYVIMDDLPMLPTGKVDRKSLQAPEGEHFHTKAEFVPPRTPVEGMLSEIWSQVLGVNRVGVFDNFFELGGHSLLATQVVSRIRNVMGIELPMRELFENPTVAGSALQAEILLRASTGLEIPPLKPLPRNPQTGLPDGDLMPSFAQQRLWFLDQLSPGNLFYNIPMAVELNGDLDVRALEKSIDEIIKRHASLRTRFKSVDGLPVQVVDPPDGLILAEECFSHLSSVERDETVREMIVEEARKPFDLSTGPLIRVRLFRLSSGAEEPKRYVFCMVMHHIVSDGWSIGVFINELLTLYADYSTSSQPSLSELNIQYYDFANWQRKWLQGEVLEKQLSYWREKLADQPKLLNLPTDRPRPAIQTSIGDTVIFEFTPELAQNVKAVCRKENVTLFMFLLTAFQILLYRYSGQDDISVGTAIANRNLMDTEALIGFFVNTLVMRTDLSGQPSFREALDRVRDTTLGAYAHQDLPFELLVEELKPERDLSHTPLFQVAFALQNAPTTQTDRVDPTNTLFSGSNVGNDELAYLVSDIELRPLFVDSGTSKFDITLTMAENDGYLQGSLEFNTDLFNPETIHRMIGHFESLLDGIVQNPGQDISTYAFLTDQELEQQIVEWNESELETPIDQCAHHRFEQQVEVNPDRIAVTYHGESLTYRSLDRKANKLATYLSSLGVGPEVLVGISTTRSIEMVIGILGVMKSGGAYLPIDPTYPVERIAFMIQDSGIPILLSQEEIVANLPLDNLETPPDTVLLDLDWDTKINESPDRPLSPDVRPDNLAYVIYTSGSTGLPKGTMLRHSGLCNLAEAQRIAFGIDGDSKILQFSPLSFDASVWETFMALANGATLCLANQEVLTPGLEMTRLMKEEAITNVTLPPSVLRVLPDEELPELKTVISAGEACTPDLVSRWAPGRNFYNAYGPTETTVCATMYLCDEEDVLPPPIGKPIANAKAYILDDNMMPVAVGVPGEMHVSGVSLARGYLKRPEMTAMKFVPDPYSEQPGTRLYKTGDLVRYRSDGSIEYLGRIDQQVKVRGFRIEIGEVEAVLNESPYIAEGTVVAREDTPGDTRLIAYYVPAQSIENGSVTSEIRKFMRKTLPEYMIPSLFVTIDEIPVTPSGKVNKKALPAPDIERSELESVYVAPRTDVEVELVKISEELLGIEQVGIHDNFFELGGHSLLATQFISRVRDSLGVELPLRILFENPTVADIAQSVKVEMSTQSDREKIAEMLQRINELSDEEVRELLELKQRESENYRS